MPTTGLLEETFEIARAKKKKKMPTENYITMARHRIITITCIAYFSKSTAQRCI